MDIKDFKSMTNQYAETCVKIIENGGSCKSIACTHCPFDHNNSTHGWGCMHYVVEETNSWEKSPSLVKNARLFLALYEQNNIILLPKEEQQ